MGQIFRLQYGSEESMDMFSNLEINQYARNLGTQDKICELIKVTCNADAPAALEPRHPFRSKSCNK